MRNLKFDWTINLGHVIVALSFIVPAAVYGVKFSSDFQITRQTVKDDHIILNKVVDTQNVQAQNIAAISKMLDYHLGESKRSGRP